MQTASQPMVLLLLAVILQAQAAGVPTPMILDGGQIIGVEQAQALRADPRVVFIDTRNPVNYGRSHIAGARLMAYRGGSANRPDFDPTLDEFDVSRLPEDKQTVIVFYSHGDTGWKSYKAAVTAISAGYQRIHWMRDGFAVWKERGLPME